MAIPRFELRGDDPCAVAALSGYIAALYRRVGDCQEIADLQALEDEFRHYQSENGAKMVDVNLKARKRFRLKVVTQDAGELTHEYDSAEARDADAELLKQAGLGVEAVR